ncbi:WYL domain-containing protein [Winogradskyella sp.]|uniref:WYL domain-containing protein n=1 Tax=Winogradskyella sp. TaxID=1883156 RepID=UPI003AB19F6E
MGIVIVIIIAFVLYSLFSDSNSKVNTSQSSTSSPNYTEQTNGSYTKMPKVETSITRTDSTEIVSRKIRTAILNNYDIKIEYKKYDGTCSKRCLSNVAFNNEFEIDGYHNDHIKGYCHLRNENRTFRIDRIDKIEILD